MKGIVLNEVAIRDDEIPAVNNRSARSARAPKQGQAAYFGHLARVPPENEESLDNAVAALLTTPKRQFIGAWSHYRYARMGTQSGGEDLFPYRRGGLYGFGAFGAPQPPAPRSGTLS